METNHLNNSNYKQLLQKFHKTNTGVILAIDAKNNSKTSINQKLQTHSNAHLQSGKQFRYIILPSDGQDRSITPINKKMRNRINKLTQDNKDVSLSKRLHECSTEIDEENDYFSKTRQMAERVIKLIPQKSSTLSVKEQAVPLQSELGRTWSQKNKDMNEASIDKSLKEDILQEMHQIRQDQIKICKHLGSFMRTFINLLLKSSTNECKMFILWLKHFLDERDLRYRLDKSECHFAEASFRIDHLCREMGQIYEAVFSSKTRNTKLKKLKKQLPMITARLLLLGLPFEIMDGDTANVPITWVRAVLMNLKDIIGDKKFLTISVLGIQGSDTSTLLNTMFGLQFAVNPKRCTRGVLMQLVPVDDNFPFEWVLVIYTEGVRTLELGHHENKQNNELATFVIGLGDIVVVNIKGEYTDKVNYVLQISVHAFKFTKDSMCEKQSCVFVHHNVPAIDANDKVHGRQKFVEIWDDITKKAVDKANIAEINSFNHVIEFDREKSVWYFSDLWLGHHSMCHDNPSYSENVANVKNAIMFGLSKKQTNYLTVTGTISRIENLWNRVLKNDFVFKFQS
ncbi:unnamed protein product [Mytilus coruscus]|uniref:VLIG-type G domain-containing protein n=1 Tax=Mytilus coruscus TaxID=42192 RepID=A0A6J8AAN7_MYTCO|nr:unnamed protein product [Mytilus coruscus]